MKIVLCSLVFLVLTSCAGSSDSGNGRSGPVNQPARKLTESEKLTLATTTVYYVETFSESDVNDCVDNLKINMIDRKGKLLVRTCKKVYSSCLMQGTCLVSIQNEKIMLNVDGKLNQVRRFKDITKNQCQFGRGANSDSKKIYNNMCVDPFFSVAADLSIYKLGDVIYLPSVVGLVLPTGEVHDGYFIVRDTGGSIRGHGRFDFFTGFYTSRKSLNPFFQIRLSDIDLFPEYFKIDGDQAEQIRKQRNFPLLPNQDSKN
jgi:3D (Asp-Asp-Asp) domain-containing protein